MDDVARVAGVSHQTVSRVLNDHPNVRDSTRDRVLVAIAQLGYRRNTAARALVTRRSGTIGVMTISRPEFGPTSTFIAVESAAREAGFYVSFATLPHAEAEGVAGVLEHFLSQAVEGVIVIAPVDSVSDALRPFAEQVPLVTIAAGTPAGQEFHPISVDQQCGARLATRHLIDLGHTDVVHLAGPQDWVDARERTIGWRDELHAAGLDAPEPIPGDWTAARGYDVGLRMVRDGVPSAIFAANDQLALGLLRAFAESGVAVPGDVSVVGFDDVVGATHFVPPLTTVRQDFVTLGRRAIAMLISAMAGRELDHTPIPPELVVRSSTGPSRRS